MKPLPPILYAEDNENDVDLTLAAFRECNLQNRIDVVSDGQMVLDYLTCNGEFIDRLPEKPVLILLDIKMPRLDGIDVLKIIKSDESLKTIPVVMLTSSSMESDLIRSYNLGANAYVVKPVDFIEFIEAIKKIGSFWAILNKTV